MHFSSVAPIFADRRRMRERAISAVPGARLWDPFREADRVSRVAGRFARLEANGRRHGASMHLGGLLPERVG